MAGSYLPRTDGSLVDWAIAFSAGISNSPGAYGLSADDTAHYATLTAAFVQSVKDCDRQIRTMVTTQIKRTNREALLAETRRLVSIISGQKTVTSADRAALGLNIPAGRTRHAVPDEAPNLRILSVDGLAVSLQIVGMTTGQTKPKHVIGATLFYFIGADFPLHASALQFAGNFSRSAIEYRFNSALPPGTPVWFVAQWLNARLEAGPMSRQQMTYLQGGMVQSHLTRRMAA